MHCSCWTDKTGLKYTPRPDLKNKGSNKRSARGVRVEEGRGSSTSQPFWWWERYPNCISPSFALFCFKHQIRNLLLLSFPWLCSIGYNLEILRKNTACVCVWGWGVTISVSSDDLQNHTQAFWLLQGIVILPSIYMQHGLFHLHFYWGAFPDFIYLLSLWTFVFVPIRLI